VDFVDQRTGRWRHVLALPPDSSRETCPHHPGQPDPLEQRAALRSSNNAFPLEAIAGTWLDDFHRQQNVSNVDARATGDA